jgi:hypothetical protein
MTAHHLLFLFLWIAPHVLQGALAIMLVHRRLAKEFPAFFLYTVFEVLQFLALFTLYRLGPSWGEQYTVVWLASGAISVALRFAIVNEVFSNLLRSYPALSAFGTLLFRWATVVLMIVAVALVAYTSGSETERGIIAFGVIDRAVSIVQCGLLVLLVLLSRFLSFSWRSYAFGIALGLGFFASIELATSAIRSHIGLAVARDTFNLVTMASYNCCVVFWIAALLRPERDRTRITSIPSHNLDQWNETLQRLLQQ